MRRRSFLRPVVLLSLSLIVGGWSAWWSGNPSPVQDRSKTEHTVLAIVWYQAAGEFRALCYQAFNLARLRLDNDFLKNKSAKKRAVIVDIDETVLDNSPHAARLIKENASYPVLWNEWVAAAQAAAIPGAVEFLTYAVSKGADVFYISNRRVDQIDATVTNLAAAGFPQATAEHMLFKDKESGKENRRQKVAQTHDIVLLMGDNLNDFSHVFEAKNVGDRFAEVDRLREEFGNKYIVLPNPIYGDWEAALYGYNYRISDEEKDAKRKGALKGF